MADLSCRLVRLRIHTIQEPKNPLCHLILKERHPMSLLARSCVVVFAVFCTASASAADFFFRDGDVVVMIGDSITEQHLYSNFVEMFSVTRFPSWKFTFRNV